MSNGKTLPQLSEATSVSDTDEVAINVGGNPRRASILTAFTGRLVRAAFGSAAAPTYTFEGDPNTGMWRDGSDVLAFSTGGAARLRLSGASAAFTVGSTAPSGVFGGTALATFTSLNAVTVGDGSGPEGVAIHSAADQIGRVGFGDTALAGWITYDHATDVMLFAVNAAERLRITNAGNVGIGTAAPAAALQVGGAVSEQRRATITSSGIATLVHTDNSQVTVLNLDNPGVAASDNGVAVAFRLATGNAALENAGVIAVVSETADYSGTGRDATMLFQTAADGMLATGLAIDSAQRVGVQTADPTAPLHVNGAARVGSSTVASLPSASTLGAGSIIFVSDETGGAVLAFSDGTDWRRVTDRAIVS